MRKIMFILLTTLLCGCEETTKPGTVKRGEEVKRVISNHNTTYNVVEIDSCEYLVKHSRTYYDHDVISITHKGNCKYCLERNRKMIENILK